MKHILKSCGFLILVVLGSREGYSQTFPNTKATAKQICKAPFTVTTIVKKPSTNPPINELPIAADLKETAIAWYKFTINTSGNLEFTITPTQLKDDIDFVLMKQINGQLSVVSRSISGPAMKGSFFHRFCEDGQRATGLKAGFSDADQCNFGTNTGATGFKDAEIVNHGETYYLAINNFFSDAGFSVNWGNSTCDFYCSSGGSNQGKQQSNNGTISEVYPNPTLDFISVDVRVDKPSVALVRIVDLYGRVISQSDFQWFSGLQKLEFDTSPFTQGSYYLDITLNENEHYVRRFVKLN